MAKEKTSKILDDKGRAKLLTPLGRVSFPHVHKPHTQGQFADEKYKLDLIFSKDDEAALKPLKLAVQAIAKNKWGENIKSCKMEEEDKSGKRYKVPFRDGDEKTDAQGNVLDGYANSIYITVKSNRKPGIIGTDKQPLDDGKEVYGGCYAICSVTGFHFVQGKKKGISFALNNVMFMKDGDSFGGGASAEEDFGKVDVSKYGIDDEEEVDEDEDFETDDEEIDDDAEEAIV